MNAIVVGTYFLCSSYLQDLTRIFHRLLVQTKDKEKITPGFAGQKSLHFQDRPGILL
jgi:hypothetical protein